MEKIRLTVEKSLRRLTLFRDDERLYVFPVALGREPVGAKSAEGDGKTPEGQYYVCTRNPRSAFYLSLGLSYPNEQDGETAFARGQVGEKERAAIAEAIRAGRRPPWDTPLGGEIMIHGHGAGKDWTQGCIAVEDAAMDCLWPLCALGTPVLILP